MKKRTLLVLFFAPLLFSASAQSLEFIYNNNALADNAIVNITNFTEDEEIGVEMTFNAVIQNKTSNVLKVVVKKEEISIPEGSINTFCTGVGCYTTYTSSEYTIAANGSDPLFHGAFSPIEMSTASIKYTASVVNSLSDKVSVTVNYQYVPAGIENVGFQSLAVIQKNNSFTIKYENDTDTYLRVFDLSGKEKTGCTLPANANSFSFNAELKKGVYLFVFSNTEGNQFTKKIIAY